MSDYTHMSNLTDDQRAIALVNWNSANQFINEMVSDHLDHMDGEECEIPCCSSEAFAQLMSELSPNQAKAVAHAAIVRLATIFKETAK